jgi:PPP family 3-phenylpropionic acid transporter
MSHRSCVQVVLFAEKRLQVALSAWQLLALAGAASVLRWGVMATNPSSALLIAMQILHGLTFGACHLGTIKFIQTAVPGSISATANALSGALSDGIFMAGATLVSGHLVANHGFGTYLAMSVMGGVGCAMAFLLGRVWDGGRLQMQ